MGFDKINDEFMGNNKIKNLDQCNSTNIISAIPFTKDGINVYAPYSSKKIPIIDLKDKIIIAGKLPPNFKGIDLLKEEKLAILNTIPTVEGAIAKAIEITDFTLKDANVLILGFGRIGKLLANRLKSFGANIYCDARKDEDLAWIESLGYKSVRIEEIKECIGKMDIIFNTIPVNVILKEIINKIKEKTTIIELASKPGGFDLDVLLKKDVNYVEYGGIPRKNSSKKLRKLSLWNNLQKMENKGNVTKKIQILQLFYIERKYID